MNSAPATAACASAPAIVFGATAGGAKSARDVVTVFIEGLVETYPGLQYLDGFPQIKVVLRADVVRGAYDKVAVISDRFKRQFAHLEEGVAQGDRTRPQLRQHVSLPRERVIGNGDEHENPTADYCIKLHVGEQPGHSSDGLNKPLLSARNFLKSESIGVSHYLYVNAIPPAYTCWPSRLRAIPENSIALCEILNGV
ncbi:hypothetical protein E2562_004626 [Oryza meyeriana var. granulata]|uniref:Uncharacterized protein n=1 Tax=Oryza meyeriana var. granulata TaxID=110450 RepID=A0A6G1F3N1_9ORYZ|nr:hypothetical protein E2562_004626 [Oryza meyeriana var. granulata]